MNRYSNSGSASPSSIKPFVMIGVVGFLILVALIGGCNYMSSFDAPRPGYAAVCQTGGPIEGDSGTCGVLAPGSGKKMIGYENKLVEFPAQQRFFRLGPGGDATEVSLPTADGVNTSIQGQARFSLAVDEKTLLDFYKKYGTRTYGGPEATEDPDKWWESFLAAQFLPLVQGGLREEISKYNCSELNPSCDLNKLNADLDKVATGNEEDKSKGRETNQRLAQISSAVTAKLQSDLESELRGSFFRNLSFRLVKVTPPENLLDEISQANAAKARLITARANARADKERAIGEAAARKEEAEGIRALNSARKSGGKIAAQIEMARALCGEEVMENGDRVAKGCPQLRAIGGGTLNLNNLNAGGGK
jgi:regulator of protease activity HflC (stomatin/prohibitin superfamily)